MDYSIYIVEDDRKIAESIAAYLQKYGYRVTLAKDFSQILSEFLLRPHLVILDINLPYQDGFHLCQQIRKTSHVPILFLSSRSGEMEQVFGIESGADDYITKPFQLEVLLAKIKAILRRVYGDYRSMSDLEYNIVSIGDLQLDLGRMELSYKGETQSLSKNEGKLLHLLMKNKGKVVLREECLEVLWDDARFVEDNTLTVNIARVRKKLAVWNFDHCVETKRGLGYRLNTALLEELS